MKLNLLIAFAAAALLMPVMPAYAAPAAKADAKAADAEPEVKVGPTDALKAKARKAKKPIYIKVAEAFKAAEMCDQPIFAFILLDDPRSNIIGKKLLTHKIFQKDLAAKNVVLLRMKQLKRDAKNPKKIDTKGLKDPEFKLLENFGTDPKAVARAKRENKDEPKFDDASNYPSVICISPDGQKELFRLPDYDSEGGFGVWISTIVDLVKTAGIEPEISPLVQKVLDNPDDSKKWK